MTPTKIAPTPQTKAEANGSALLKLSSVDLHYGSVQALRKISLDVHEGEIVALLGANGAGKSSLVLAVAGLLRATGGRVLLDDRELTNRRPERIRSAGVAVVPEGRRLFYAVSRRSQNSRKSRRWWERLSRVPQGEVCPAGRAFGRRWRPRWRRRDGRH